MDMSMILAAIYGLVAVFAALMTRAEQRRSATHSRVFTPLAYVFCALWPVAILAMLVSMQFDRAAMARRQPGV